MCKEVQKQFDPIQEHDACGIGADCQHRREKREHLHGRSGPFHRRAAGASCRQGRQRQESVTASAFLLQISHRFFKDGHGANRAYCFLISRRVWHCDAVSSAVDCWQRRKAEQLLETISQRMKAQYCAGLARCEACHERDPAAESAQSLHADDSPVLHRPARARREQVWHSSRCLYVIRRQLRKELSRTRM